MWPRLIAQLLELLPHVTRLVPIADRYFSSKSSGDQAALAQIADQLRGDLSQTQASTEARLEAQSTQLAAIEAALQRVSVELASQRTEQQAAHNELLFRVKAGAATIVALLVTVLVLLLIRGR